MRSGLVWSLSIVLLTSVAFGSAPGASAELQRGASAIAADVQGLWWEPPGEPETPPEAPAAERPPPRRVRGQRPPAQRGPGAVAGPGSRRGDHVLPGPPPLVERLFPLIAERHPELAARLKRIREESPEEFRGLLADALALRLEEALETRGFGPGMRPPRSGPRAPGGARRGERGPGTTGPPGDEPWRGGPRPPSRGSGPDWDAPGREVRGEIPALEREMEELHRHNEELERRSMELARRFRELCERRDPGLEPERDEVRRAIEATVEEHFNLRTELRRIELRRVEMELDRLREMVERIRHDLERREEARGAITERRLNQLLGQDTEGW